MKDKAIEILRQQLLRLDHPDFDLEGWKSQTIVLLGRIFGERSYKTERIRNLHYDYSSWALRDTRGKSSPLEAAKQSARDLLEAALTELEQFGVPDEAGSSPVLDAIRASLEEHVKISTYRNIARILQADIAADKRREELRDLLRDAHPDLPEDFFISLFSHPGMKGQLKE
jgi:hypothetical protein